MIFTFPPKERSGSIVLVGGCFDMLHFGHTTFLTQAKKLGDYLIVALESDENVRRRKGPMRPIHTQEQRKQMLLSLTVVDEVVCLPEMVNDDDYFSLVQTIQPNIIATTSGDPYLDTKRAQALTVGARVKEIPSIKTPSTSQLAKLLELE